MASDLSSRLPSLAVAATAALFIASAVACRSTPPAEGAPMAGQTAASSTPVTGWRSLIDPTLSAWRGYKEQSLPGGWTVADGVLSKDGDQHDLLSRDEFGDFELEFDWRLAPGGNSGVFYRATEEYEHVYWSGPEYQLLDDARHPDGRSRLTAAGADYGLFPAPAGVVHAANEWNQSRIVARGAHVEHWLNGQKLLEYEVGSAGWKTALQASKFSAWPHYGAAPRGHIGLQGDHPGLLSLRNMRIRALP